MRHFVSVAAALAIASTAQAQAVKSERPASNGVLVTVYSDDFANRHEYSAPSIDVTDGYALVIALRNGGTVTPAYVTGSFIYSGEWRRYNSALFKGGDPAKFIERGRDVGQCSSSRYSRPSCTLTESFRIELSADDIKKHTVDGRIAIQVRAQDTSTAIFEIPVTYINAVNELASSKP